MKKLLMTTAISLVLGTGAMAAAHMLGTDGYVTMQGKGDVLASEFIGARIYATENEVNAETRIAAGGEKEWDDIGEVNDVILGADGSVKAVILGIGGFLGMGEKDVAVPMDQVRKVLEEGADDTSDYFLVINANKQTLTDAPAFERLTAMKTDAAAMKTTEPAATPTDVAPRPMLVRPEVMRDGYASAKVEELTASDLEGARVYGAKDEDVGEINSLIMNTDGTVKEVILDIGGFLGMGEHQIGVSMDELNIQRDADGNTLIFIDATQEALKAQPEYKG